MHHRQDYVQIYGSKNLVDSESTVVQRNEKQIFDRLLLGNSSGSLPRQNCELIGATSVKYSAIVFVIATPLGAYLAFIFFIPQCVEEIKKMRKRQRKR